MKRDLCIGGLVGSMNGGSIVNSSSSGIIIVTADFDDYRAGNINISVGGAVGNLKNGTLNNVTSSTKIYIRDVKKFDSLQSILEKTMDNEAQLESAKQELDWIKSNIGKPSMASKVERFLNIVNGVRDVVDPFVPYLMSLV